MWMPQHRGSIVTGDRDMEAPGSFRLRRIKAEQLTGSHRADLGWLGQATGGPEADPEAWLERHLAHWTEHGFGIWVLRDPAGGRVMGHAGLRHIEVDHAGEVEVLFGLVPEFRGRGLATDAARACVAIGRDWLGLPSMVGLTLPDDQASQRVLIKAELTYKRQVTHEARPHLLFRTD